MLLTHGPNTTQRKCTAFILSKLPESTRDSLLKGQGDLIDCLVGNVPITQQSACVSAVEQETTGIRIAANRCGIQNMPIAPMDVHQI